MVVASVWSEGSSPSVRKLYTGVIQHEMSPVAFTSGGVEVFSMLGRDKDSCMPVFVFLFRASELRKYVGPCVLLEWYVRNFFPVELFHMFPDQVQIFYEVVVLSLVFPLNLRCDELGVCENLYFSGIQILSQP